MFTRMLKQKSGIFCIAVSIVIIIASSLTASHGLLQTNDQYLQYNDFSSLTQYHNGSFINSINHNSSLVFEPSYSGDSPSLESYILIFDEHGICSDFSISLTFEYEYTSNTLGKFEFLAGAYAGTHTTRVLGCSMDDDDSSHEGVFLIHTGSFGSGHVSFSQSGKVQFNLGRTANQYSIEIFKDDVLVDESSGDIDTAINFFQVKFEPHSELYYFNFECTTLEAELYTDGISVNYNPFFDHNEPDSSGLQIFFIILGAFLGIFVLAGFGSFVLDRIRRRQRINRVLKQREEAEEELDETEIEIFGQDFSEPLVVGPTTEPHHLAGRKQAAQSLHYRTVAKEMLFDAEKMGIAKCMICKKELKQEQEVYQCPYCEAFFHKEHFVVWVNVKGTCPVCHQKLIKK